MAWVSSSWISSLRIEEAKRIMANDPKQKLIDVAYKAGFSSLAYFSSVFAKSEGTSPSVGAEDSLEIQKVNNWNSKKTADWRRCENESPQFAICEIFSLLSGEDNMNHGIIDDNDW